MSIMFDTPAFGGFFTYAEALALARFDAGNGDVDPASSALAFVAGMKGLSSSLDFPRGSVSSANELWTYSGEVFNAESLVLLNSSLGTHSVDNNFTGSVTITRDEEDEELFLVLFVIVLIALVSFPVIAVLFALHSRLAGRPKSARQEVNVCAQRPDV